MSEKYPILDFDPAQKAVIEPTVDVGEGKMPEHCVLCFHRDVVARVKDDHNATLVRELEWESGPHPVWKIEVDGREVAFLQPGIGAPLAGGLLEACIAMGGSKFMACGGAGVLDSNIDVGHPIIPVSAVRDEGTSYHYLAAGLEAVPSDQAVDALRATLESHNIPYLTGRTWTTDAPYRETHQLVKQRKAGGCITVEMEAAALFAIAQFRSVTFGQILYGGDDVSGQEWDTRDWQKRHGIREQLFWLAVEACLRL
jgi:uridine phosphorylase